MNWASLLQWLKEPLSEGLPLARWAFLLALLLLLLSAIFIAILRRARRCRKSSVSARAATGSTHSPDNSDSSQARLPLAVANLQGLGSREEQQDAFALSALDACEEKGVMAILCDGMGGLSSGREIAQKLVCSALADFPYEQFAADASERSEAKTLIGEAENSSAFNTRPAAGETLSQNWSRQLAAYSALLYREYRASGGSTLLMCYLHKAWLYFWSVGDSDLFLLRAGHLYSVNQRHEYINALLLHALELGDEALSAMQNPQKSALSHFMGGADFDCDASLRPFSLEEDDRLLLCSDGISDSLSLEELQSSLSLAPDDCCRRMEELIAKKALPKQDNYTAIVIHYQSLNRLSKSIR